MISRLLRSIRVKKLKRRLRAVGEGLKLFGTPVFTQPESISIGKNVNINDGAVLNATGSSISIGNDVTVSAKAMILAATYDTEAFIRGGSGAKAHKFSEVVIGDNVWICAGAIILPGVKIPDHVIVGAGSVVTRTADESYCILAGNPARVVRRIDK